MFPKKKKKWKESIIRRSLQETILKCKFELWYILVLQECSSGKSTLINSTLYPILNNSSSELFKNLLQKILWTKTYR